MISGLEVDVTMTKVSWRREANEGLVNTLRGRAPRRRRGESAVMLEDEPLETILLKERDASGMRLIGESLWMAYDETDGVGDAKATRFPGAEKGGRDVLARMGMMCVLVVKTSFSVEVLPS
jgi:hypothetical protein